ncbi:hypothetical protein [Marinobacter sp.]|uniref:hypothetical protein n=1 Tax=Gammaproteobacteria TaxID=1236 RepID=UPI003A8FC03D
MATGSSKFTFSNRLQGNDTDADAIGPFVIPPQFGNLDPTLDPAFCFNYFATSATANAETPPNIPTDTNQPVFALQFKKSNSGGSQIFEYVQITVSKNYIFSQVVEQRTAMLAAFRTFRTQVEALEAADTEPGLRLGTTDALMNYLATNLALTTPEIPRYYYGFDPSNQSIDLLPGTALRLEYAPYQYVAPPGVPGYEANAFAGTGSVRIPIARKADLNIAFDTMIGNFAPGIQLSPAASPCPDIAASLLDLEIQSFARKHWRLVTPPTLPGPTQVSNSGGNAAQTSVLLGADTYADLDAATTAFLSNSNQCTVAQAGNNPIVSISFTGRVIGSVDIECVVNGAREHVAVGTTIRDLIFRNALVPPQQMTVTGSSGGVFAGASLSCQLQRWISTVQVPSVNLDSATYLGVFDFKPAQTGDPILDGLDGDVFDVPVARGDRIYVGPKDSLPTGSTQ